VAAPEAAPAPATLPFQQFSLALQAVVGNAELRARVKDLLIAYGAATIQDVEPADRAAFLEEAGL
jgi:hypothetical protein